MTAMTLLEKCGALLQRVSLCLGLAFLFVAARAKARQEGGSSSVENQRPRAGRPKKMRGSEPRGTCLYRFITNIGLAEGAPEFLMEAAWG